MPGDARASHANDYTLLARLRDGDTDAFDAIYLEHYERLATFAERIAHAMEPADDIVQDVFLSLWERRATIVIVPPIAAYLYAAVRNRALLARRRTHTAERITARLADTNVIPGAGTFVSDPEQRFEASEIRAALRAAIAQLPERQHLALRLYFDAQLAPAAIAQVLNIHEQVARKLLAKAMKKLSVVLQQAEG